MGIEQRRHPRYGVHLAVRYPNAQQFVNDYIENLSVGGLFIAGAQQLPMGTETDVEVELPGQGTWTVRARSVFIIDPVTARQAKRRAGAGMEIITKPPGFDDALLGYLLRLGRRRDHAVMAGEVIGIELVGDAGYRVLPLEPPNAVAIAIADTAMKIVALVVPPSLAAPYRDALGEHASRVLFSASSPEEVVDILARIDSLL